MKTGHPVIALLVILTVAGWSGAARTAEPAAGSSIDAFRELISQEARYAADPWTLAHALTGTGPGLQLAGGEKGVERLKAFLRDAGTEPHFDPDSSGGTLGEMHPHLVFKTLAAEGMEPDLCAGLSRAAALKLKYPASPQEWNDVAWLLEGLARTPGHHAGTPLGTEKRTLAELAAGALRQVEAADRVVEKLLAESPDGSINRPRGGGDPTSAGIWSYTCGGQHLLQGVIVAYENRLIPESEKPRLDARVGLFLSRVKGEALFRERERDDAMSKGVSPLLAHHNHTLQVLKLYGHALETLARARSAGVGDPAAVAAEAQRIAAATEVLLSDFGRHIQLAKLLPAIRTGDPATWRKWFGDGCHLIHGLRLWSEMAAASPGVKKDR